MISVGGITTLCESCNLHFDIKPHFYDKYSTKKALYDGTEMDAKLRDSSDGRCLKGQKGRTLECFIICDEAA